MELLRRKVSWSTALLLVLIVAVVTAFVAHRVGVGSGGDDSSKANGSGGAPAVQFTGVVASLYPTKDGGCVRADGGQGVETGADANCGPFYLVPGTTATVGAKVAATSVDETDKAGEAIQGFLLSGR